MFPRLSCTRSARDIECMLTHACPHGLHCENNAETSAARDDDSVCGMSQQPSSYTETARLRPSVLARLAKRGAASVLAAGAGASAWYLYRSAQPEESHPEQPDLQSSPQPPFLSGIDPHAHQRQASSNHPRAAFNNDPGSPYLGFEQFAADKI